VEPGDGAPPGKYETDAGWIVAALASGAAADGVADCLQSAVSMELEALPFVEQPIASKIVDEGTA
jgi:hypothetical protein